MENVEQKSPVLPKAVEGENVAVVEQSPALPEVVEQSPALPEVVEEPSAPVPKPKRERTQAQKDAFKLVQAKRLEKVKERKEAAKKEAIARMVETEGYTRSAEQEPRGSGAKARPKSHPVTQPPRQYRLNFV